MTIKEKLLEEFECAINAVYGDLADYDYETNKDWIINKDINDIAMKVKFYLGL